MGKLAGIRESLDGLAKQSRREVLADTFGVDPSLLEESEPYQPGDQELMLLHVESITASLADIAERLEKSINDQSDALKPHDISAELKAISKAVQAREKAHKVEVSNAFTEAGNALKAALQGLEQGNTAGLQAIMSHLADSSGEIQQLITVLGEKLAPPERKPARFDVIRNENGLIDHVVAMPLDEYTPIERERFE